MDRIRAAISRARDENTKATPAPARAAATAQVQKSDTGGDFPPIACDFASFSRNRIISNEQDPVLNAYRVLRTRVLQKMDAEGWKTLAVVSPGAAAGKTVTAINLAIAISAKDDSPVGLVDVDFYRPSVARYLGVKGFNSSLDYFEGMRPLSDVIVRPDVGDIMLMANERVTRRGAEHLTSDKMDRLIDTTLNEYGARVVVFDMSPILGCDDTIAFLPKVDCVLLVAASGQTRVADLKEGRRILGQSKIVGTVLNKAPSALVANPYY